MTDVISARPHEQDNAQSSKVKEGIGIAQWFDSIKNYGFIMMSDGSDIFVYGDIVRNTTWRRLLPGSQVAFLYRESKKGYQCTQITHIEEVTDSYDENIEGVEVSDWLSGQCVSFGKKGGFGFIKRGDGQPDVFLSANTLCRCGMPLVYAGQPVEVRVARTEPEPASLTVVDIR